MRDRRRRKESARKGGGLRLDMRVGEQWWIGECLFKVIGVTESGKVSVVITSPDGTEVVKDLEPQRRETRDEGKSVSGDG